MSDPLSMVMSAIFLLGFGLLCAVSIGLIRRERKQDNDAT